MRLFNNRFYRAGLVSVSIIGLSWLTGCSSPNQEKDAQKHRKELDVTVTEPIERDYAAIKEDGALRMITRYSSNTYFIHQGTAWGFEYELVKRFAKNHDLALEVVIIGPNQNPYDMLNSGKGDLIAGNYTRTPTRKKYVGFTRPYNLVNQTVVYSSDIKDPPQSLQKLADRRIPISIRKNSSYYQRLQDIQKEGINIPIQLVSNQKDTESLLFDISNDKYSATVADNNIFQASNKYMKGLRQGPVIAKNDTIAWAVRKNSPDLENKLNQYLYKHFRFGKAGEDPKRSTFLNVLRERYFEAGSQIADYHNRSSEIPAPGVISPYDGLIKEVSDSANVDWLLIASIVAQETRFNPESKSWAGAVGLMQVLPRYSDVKQEEHLYDAKTNLREGIRILKGHLKHYSYMDSTDRWSFALASYNAGQGHLADARRLAIDHNKNPNNWDNASDALLKLMQRKYYRDARYGFCRGIETVRYVKEIKSRYQTYKTILTMNRQKQDNIGFGNLGLFNMP